jgi:hypothetical protein
MMQQRASIFCDLGPLARDQPENLIERRYPGNRSTTGMAQGSASCVVAYQHDGPAAAVCHAAKPSKIIRYAVVFPSSFLEQSYDLVYTDGSAEVFHR